MNFSSSESKAILLAVGKYLSISESSVSDFVREVGELSEQALDSAFSDLATLSLSQQDGNS